MRIPYVKKNTNNIIDTGTALVGDIHSDNDWVILGTIAGVLKTGGNVYIEATAQINGDIYGDHIWVAGAIVGNIYAGRELHLLDSSSVEGSIQYGKLHVEEGAYLSGQSIAGLHVNSKDKSAVGWNENRSTLPRFF